MESPLPAPPPTLADAFESVDTFFDKNFIGGSLLRLSFKSIAEGGASRRANDANSGEKKSPSEAGSAGGDNGNNGDGSRGNNTLRMSPAVFVPVGGGNPIAKLKVGCLAEVPGLCSFQHRLLLQTNGRLATKISVDDLMDGLSVKAGAEFDTTAESADFTNVELSYAKPDFYCVGTAERDVRGQTALSASAGAYLACFEQQAAVVGFRLSSGSANTGTSFEGTGNSDPEDTDDEASAGLLGRRLSIRSQRSNSTRRSGDENVVFDAGLAFWGNNWNVAWQLSRNATSNRWIALRMCMAHAVGESVQVAARVELPLSGSTAGTPDGAMGLQFPLSVPWFGSFRRASSEANRTASGTKSSKLRSRALWGTRRFLASVMCTSNGTVSTSLATKTRLPEKKGSIHWLLSTSWELSNSNDSRVTTGARAPLIPRIGLSLRVVCE